jgi:hypothetical protein
MPSSLDDEAGSIAPFAQRLITVTKFIFWPFVTFTFAFLTVEVGFWQITETQSGFFAQNAFVPASLSGRAIGFASDGEHTFKCCIGLRSDINEHRLESDLRINNHKMGPARAPHELIRYGETTGFSNWAGYDAERF